MAGGVVSGSPSDYKIWGARTMSCLQESKEKEGEMEEESQTNVAIQRM